MFEVINPHGFCMGVKAAIDAANHTLSVSDGAVYCLHELVHNECVINELKAKGMTFVTSLAEIPEGVGATVLFSAHGVSPQVRMEAQRRSLKIVDATCPFVARVHRQVCDYVRRGKAVVVIGHSNHVEVRGVADEARAVGAMVRVVETVADVAKLDYSEESELGVVCQTTLASNEVELVIAALRTRYANIETPAAAEVCTATRDRQNAVRAFVECGGDGVIVLGSAMSSNTHRLAEIAEQCGARAWRIGNLHELKTGDFSGIRRLGITSGASTPESFFVEATDVLRGS